MNCCTEVLELTVESRQVEEATLALLHTIFMHRSTGKFHYNTEGNYSITTVGTRDTDCHFIDFTFVRVSSEELDSVIRRTVSEFKEALNSSGRTGMGHIRLEFYQRKKCLWPFSDKCIPWEVWNISITFVSLVNEKERHICWERVGKTLGEMVVNVAEVVSLHQYLPNTPTQSEVDSVFDTSLRDFQPYLHKITYQVSDPS